MFARPAVIALFSLTMALRGQDAQATRVRRVILGFIEARNSHEGASAAAAYSADGEYIDATGNAIQGRSALAKLWSGSGIVPRTLTDVKIVTRNIALATVDAHFFVGTQNVIGKETFLLIKDDGEWRIRVHQRLD